MAYDALQLAILVDCLVLPSGATFGGFRPTQILWTAWTELHQTRFLRILQAIPVKSKVGNGKIPVLADCHRFSTWSDFWWFLGLLQAIQAKLTF